MILQSKIIIAIVGLIVVGTVGTVVYRSLDEQRVESVTPSPEVVGDEPSEVKQTAVDTTTPVVPSAKSPQTSSVAPSKSQPASPPSGWIAFSNNEVGISFFYPPAWGEVIPTDNPYRTQFLHAYMFSILERESRYPISKNMTLEVNIAADARARGKTVKDSYSGEGGNTSRGYTLFSGTHRIEVTANYSVSDYYDDIYKQGDSILDLVRDDIGEDVPDPIKNLLRVHPEWTEMKTFYANVDTMVSTMKY